MLALVMVDTWWASAILLALSVHLKTYPAPWAFTIWLYYASQENRKFLNIFPWSWKGIKYAFLSFVTFVLLTGTSFHFYGNDFLSHAHLHHISRQDTRHNFSV